MRKHPLVLVLHDDVPESAPPEALDTLVQARAIHAALVTAGFAVECVPVTLDMQQLKTDLQARNPALVFNLVESPGGSDRLAPMLPAMLEQLQIPFTGAGYAAMLRLTDKTLAKQWLSASGVPTPAWWCSGDNRKHNAAAGPWIVKSVWEHASFGLTSASVVASLTEARQELRRCQNAHGGEWFAEQYIAGREFNVAVMETGDGPSVLPLAEIVFEDFPADMPAIVDYAAKWEPGSFAYEHTRRQFMDVVAEGALAVRLHETALKTWQACSLKGYARVDMRVDADSQPWVVDVNPNPCLAPDAGFAAAAAVAGMTYPALIAALAEYLLVDQPARKTG